MFIVIFHNFTADDEQLSQYILLNECVPNIFYSYGLEQVIILWDALTLQQLKVVVVGESVGGAVMVPSPPSTNSEDHTFRLVIARQSGKLFTYYYHTRQSGLLLSYYYHTSQSGQLLSYYYHTRQSDQLLSYYYHTRKSGQLPSYYYHTRQFGQLLS